MRVSISRHATKEFYSSGVGVFFGLGEVIETVEWGADHAPRKGELVTCHPDGAPSERSWTGEVTGVQSVFRAGWGQVVCVTVRDETQVERAAA